jgi:hypothetical protein
MATRKSTRRKASPRNGSGAALAAVLGVSDRAWAGFALEYYLLALVEAWDCPDELVPAVAIEFLESQHGANDAAGIWDGMRKLSMPRARLLTLIEMAIEDELAKPYTAGRFKSLRRAIRQSSPTSKVRAAGAALDVLVRD